MTIIWCTVPEIWSMKDSFLSFWTICCPFTPLKTQKNQNFEKMKKNAWIYHFTQVQQKLWSYDILYLRYGAWQMYLLFLILGYFGPFTPLTAWKMKISKKWKNHHKISSFYTCVPKIMIRWCTAPEIWCVTDRQTNGQTNEWKKWQIEVGASPNNMFLTLTTPDDIEVSIGNMKVNKGVGPNSIPSKILKDYKSEFSKPLTDMINTSFTTGIFPVPLQ